MKRQLCASVFAGLLISCGSADANRTEPLLQLALEGRYGSTDGPLALREIREMALTHGVGDTLLITQNQVPAILILSSKGDSLGMLGRGGSGPGEFSRPLSVGILRDTIWVPDARSEVLRFHADGKYIDQLRIMLQPLGPFQRSPVFQAALADGTLLFRGLSAATEPGRGSTVPPLAWIRVHRSAVVIDTLALLQQRESGLVLTFPNQVTMVTTHPAANPDRATVDPEGRWIVVARQELDETVQFGFTVRWISLTGDTVGEHSVQTVPVSSEPVREELVDRLERGEGYPLALTEGLSRGAIESAVNDVAFPVHQAPALDIFADSDGRAWIKSPHVAADSSKWYVVDRESGLEGVVTMSNDVELMAAHARTVWGWERGSYDVPRVLKFSLR